jgi:sirohydrochlorin cobaltochelatase
MDALQRWSIGGGNGLPPLHTHTHTDANSPAYARRWEGARVLPPRYRDGEPVSAAAMAAAPLQYDADGRVAWDQVWTGFCELALAGGPPHRGTLLEPVTPTQVAAGPDAYRQVLAELTRGLELVTGLPVTSDAPPGWSGITCSSEEMALWLLRAIVVENISVRREDRTLFLPAGPAFQVEHEIKNIVTAVAKTYHYWTEHQAAR